MLSNQADVKTEQLRVLVVEDDADSRENLVDILELDGVQVDTAGTIAEALEPRDWSALCAVVLDRKLPDGDASRLLSRIKSRAPGAAMIIVTGLSDLDGAIAALREGATDYLIKPVNPDAIRATLQRVLEQRRVKAALEATEERLRVALKNSDIGCFSQDAELRYTWAYNAFGGMPAESLLGKTDRDLFSQQQAEQLEELKQSVLASGQAGRAEVPLTVQGRSRWYELAIEPRSEDGEVRGLTGVVIDITEKKRAQEHLLQQERLAAIGETMAGLVHEGRNALQRSKACLEMLALEVEDRPEALNLLERMKRAQDHLHQLYEEVRQYAAPLVLNRDTTCIASLLRETWSYLTHDWEPRQIAFELDAPQPHIYCAVDRFLLTQVFRNLLENAIEVTPDRGAIKALVRAVKVQGIPSVEVRIRDQGPGIPAECRPRVFEAFFTTKTKGTGLGLAISDRIVRAHEGSIEVAEGDGPGAEFVITLPIQ